MDILIVLLTTLLTSLSVAPSVFAQGASSANTYGTGVGVVQGYSAPQQVTFSALAMTSYGNGWGWGQGITMEGARRDAVFQCESSNGPRTCTSTVAEDSAWFFVGLQCAGYTYVAASRYGFGQAISVAFGKARSYDDFNCSVVVQQHNDSQQ